MPQAPPRPQSAHPSARPRRPSQSLVTPPPDEPIFVFPSQPSTGVRSRPSSAQARSEIDQVARGAEAPKHLAQALLLAKEGSEPSGQLESQMLQAAVMQMAPTTRLAPCGSSLCCWRWASQQLLNEYAAARNTAGGLRAVLDEELGQSAKQRLLNLKEDYEALHHRMRTSTEELALLRKRFAALEVDHAAAAAARDEAVASLQASEQARVACEEQAAARERQLEGQLAAANRRPGARELEAMLEEERQNSQEIKEGWDKANEELITVRLERTDLEWKLTQLRLALNKCEQKKKKPKRPKTPERRGATSPAFGRR